MTSRAMRLLAVASVVLALPMAAQRAGTIEVGGFARYVNFDNTLPMGDDMDIGGRVGVYLEPALTLEVDLARSSQSSVTYTPLHVRAVYNGSVSGRIEALVGGGYVRNWYGAPYSASSCGCGWAPTWTSCSTRRTTRSSPSTTGIGGSTSAPACGSIAEAQVPP